MKEAEGGMKEAEGWFGNSRSLGVLQARQHRADREAPLALRAARGASEQFLAAAYFASAVGEERAVRMLQVLRHRKLRLKTA